MAKLDLGELEVNVVYKVEYRTLPTVFLVEENEEEPWYDLPYINRLPTKKLCQMRIKLEEAIEEAQGKRVGEDGAREYRISKSMYTDWEPV